MIGLDRLTKRFGTHLAVDQLTLDVAEGEVCVLVGPSGCGKTTTLKMINRLVEPSGGRIFIAGDDVTDVDPVQLRRRVGYVIQHVGLFPHQSVGANVATVPRLLGWERDRIRARVDELLVLVGLDPDRYRDRYPRQLSGGQQQRVGVARALGADPPVLLMDEPFGSIDPITRSRLQGEFLRLQAEVRKTVVFVTHDVDEAVRLADRVAVLADGGVLAQHGSPAEVLRAPASAFVADFVGADRALKALAVTPVSSAALDQPPRVVIGDGLGEARHAIGEARYAVVVDSEGAVVGQLKADDAHGDGAVQDRVSAAPPTVTTRSSLREALSAALLAEESWVPVLLDGRYEGVLTLAALHRAGHAARDTLVAP